MVMMSEHKDRESEEVVKSKLMDKWDFTYAWGSVVEVVAKETVVSTRACRAGHDFKDFLFCSVRQSLLSAASLVGAGKRGLLQLLGVAGGWTARCKT